MIHHRFTLARLAVLILATICLASCDVLGLSIGDSSQRARVRRQEARWASQNIGSYRLTYQRECFCGTEFTTPTVIEVRGGDIQTARYADRDDPIPLYVQANLPTVESLFAIIHDAIDRDADLIEVTYDPARGFPRKIAIDYRFATADDEVIHTVSNLEIFLPPVVP